MKKTEKLSAYEEINNMAKNISRVIILLTNGKAYLDITDKGVKFVVPPELQEGFNELMKMGEPETKPSIDFDKINQFHKLCGVDITWVEDDRGVECKGKDKMKMLQFLKTCIGYDIKDENLF